MNGWKVAATAVFLSASLSACSTPPARLTAAPALYGVLGRMISVPGKREQLIAILIEGTGAMPGNKSYVIARDLKDPNAIWITEVWESRDAHAASLKLPRVQRAIKAARPLIAGFDSRAETQPLRAN